MALIGLTPSMFAMQTKISESTSCLYEMRTYYAADGKYEELHERFRDYTLRIFAKHGIQSVGYWTPKENTKDVLIYILTYPNEGFRDNAWANFRADPEWQNAVKITELTGKLVDRVESVYLYKTDYSPMRCPEP